VFVATVGGVKGRVALITGATRGLGRAVAERCLADDAIVVVVGTDAESVATTAAELGDRAHGVCGDVRTRQGCEEIIKATLAVTGRIDVLVNNAGVYPRAALLDIDDEQWEADVSVNVRGVSHMTALVARHVIARNSPGHVVNVGSVDAFLAWPDNAHYAATKAAVVSLTKSFALQLAPHRILVNGVAPSAMATEQARQAGWLDELAAQIPLGRAADPAEVADVIHYLGSSRTTFVTGETIAVAGGFLFR
jgi:NAD(P)-dependent dehydrogenase (short-subunit alcohol dehydrogenase family)